MHAGRGVLLRSATAALFAAATLCSLQVGCHAPVDLCSIAALPQLARLALRNVAREC